MRSGNRNAGGGPETAYNRSTVRARGARRSGGVWNISLNTGMLLFSIMMIYPFWDTFMLSFAKPEEAATLGFHLWNKNWSLSSYQFIFRNNQVMTAYGNTIFITVVGTFLALAITVLAAFPLSKKDLPGRSAITMIFVFTMFFSGGVVPFYLTIKALGLMDTRWVLILPQVLNVFYLTIMRNYMMSLDKALEESAMMDGAGYLTVLYRIILPIARPILATLVLWNAVAFWNQWYHALLFIRDDRKLVLQLLLRRLIEYSSAEGVSSMEVFRRQNDAMLNSATVKAAVILITIGPIIFFYPFIQKHFIKGITVGSLKG
ncbi:carbohydrate ABC transporter permease [Paenibacillus koleovorans]|uniref:carbohydrate ABC transporter permease n=1 Tax=Paenibacillus koleovorans TaxID=121608 RepID=UPI0013E39A75|nr:carbohydrate ABC transporter permease [Paenibacillus koleovorans]